MNFRTAFLAATRQRKDLSPALRAKLDRAAKADPARHKRLWMAMEHIVAHRYERETGQKITANFDWSKLMQWLIDNLPAILKIVASLLALFAV
jgi:hypothetical protein